METNHSNVLFKVKIGELLALTKRLFRNYHQRVLISSVYNGAKNVKINRTKIKDKYRCTQKDKIQRDI